MGLVFQSTEIPRQTVNNEAMVSFDRSIGKKAVADEKVRLGLPLIDSVVQNDTLVSLDNAVKDSVVETIQYARVQ